MPNTTAVRDARTTDVVTRRPAHNLGEAARRLGIVVRGDRLWRVAADR
jgi:hypothetical protein